MYSCRCHRRRCRPSVGCSTGRGIRCCRATTIVHLRRGGGLCGVWIWLLLRRQILPDGAPLHGQGTENRQTSHDQRRLETSPEGIVVRLQRLTVIPGGNEIEQVRHTVVLDQLGADPGDLEVAQFLDEFIVQHVLADRGEDGTEEGLPEEHERHADGHILAGQHGLRGHVGRLVGEPHADAVADLVSDPLTLGGGDVEGGEEAGPDGRQARPENHCGRVVPYPRDELTVEDGCYDHGQEHREEVNAARHG